MFKKSVPPSIRQERFVPPSIRQNRFVHPSNRQKESFIRLSVQTENRSSVYPSEEIVHPSNRPNRKSFICLSVKIDSSIRLSVKKDSFIRLSVKTENRSSVYPSKKIRSSVYPSKQKIVPPSRVQKYCFFARKTHFSIKNMAFSMEITNFAALYT